ncbi:MAG: squalene/phytoene synthase family protein [Alphaproteobacteria bacterium]|nr:squalene/phytoene synthase family protein [Alphaproteobacteria bacterium]
MGALTPCGVISRRHDSDRFLCALFAPPGRRDHVFALIAFEHEIAKTRSVVSEPMLGQIRLQWWRDAIDSVFAGHPRKHEVVEGVDLAVRSAGLPRALFEGMIDARENELEGPPPDLQSLVRHADATGGALAALWLHVLWPDRGGPPETAIAVARDAGAAFALVGTLRAAAALAAEGRQVIPTALLPETARAQAQAGRDCAEIAAAAQQILDVARARLAVTRNAAGDLPGSARSAVLQAVLARRYAAEIARDEHRLFGRRRGAPSPWRPIWLAWAAARGRF